MPVTSSFQAQLTSFRKNFLQKASSSRMRFTALMTVHEKFADHAKDLSILKYGTSIMVADENYQHLKLNCKAEHHQLKQQQKKLDERTLVIEQQLYLGLPDDLKEMEKVITAQEDILEDQQRINQLEEQLLEKMRIIDIDHGKTLAAIEQAAADRTISIRSAQEEFELKLAQEEKKINIKAKLFSLIPILIIPIGLDFLTYQTNTSNHFIFSHYVFLISLILLEVFAADWIKERISGQLSLISCKTIATELEFNWTEQQEQLKKLENKYNTTIAIVKEAIGKSQ